jgi:hypothetical protein
MKSGGALSRRLVEWTLTVPRLLWELGTRDLVFTEVGSVGAVTLNDPPFFY